MATTVTDIINSMESIMQTQLGSSYKQLAYKEDVQKNSFRTSNDRFGVRALESSQIPGVTKYVTYNHTFEVILTKGYVQSNIDDTEQVDSGLELRAEMLDIYNEFVNQKAGLPGTVLQITNSATFPIEYLEEDKVTVLRTQVEVTYRLSLI